METKILKVVRQGEVFSVQSAKAETGTIHKCNIVLRELGGKFENEYVCAMLGNLAVCRFYEGDVVVATLLWPPFVSLHTSIRDRRSKKF